MIKNGCTLFQKKIKMVVHNKAKIQQQSVMDYDDTTQSQKPQN